MSTNPLNKITYMIEQRFGSCYRIAVPQFFIQMFGLNSAVLLTQLIYWSGKTKKEWIFKSDRVWEEETGLKRGALDTAVKLLEKLEFIQTKQYPAKGHNTTHYKVYLEKVKDFIMETTIISAEKGEPIIYGDEIAKISRPVARNMVYFVDKDLSNKIFTKDDWKNSFITRVWRADKKNDELCYMEKGTAFYPSIMEADEFEITWL